MVSVFREVSVHVSENVGSSPTPPTTPPPRTTYGKIQFRRMPMLLTYVTRLNEKDVEI
jgi:hypothetical protein